MLRPCFLLVRSPQVAENEWFSLGNGTTIVAMFFEVTGFALHHYLVPPKLDEAGTRLFPRVSSDASHEPLHVRRIYRYVTRLSPN
jgi:hypothetical protein